MQKILIALCVLIASPVSADDVTLAKEVFGKFAEYQKTDDPRILDLVAGDCRGEIVQSDGTLEISTPVPPTRFRQGIEANLKKKEGNPNPYEEVEYQAFENAVSVSGVIHFVKDKFKGPFRMTLKKDKEGAMKISYVSITGLLSETPVKGGDLFEFVMPGEWKIRPLQKRDLGEGRILHIGGGTSQNGSLGYTAFESKQIKPEDQELKEFHWAAVEPIIKKMTSTGGKEKPPLVGELTPGDKDQLYFIYPVQGPDNSVMRISGMTIRTKTRVYTVYSVGEFTAGRDLWLAVAKSFKEL